MKEKILPTQEYNRIKNTENIDCRDDIERQEYFNELELINSIQAELDHNN